MSRSFTSVTQSPLLRLVLISVAVATGGVKADDEIRRQGDLFRSDHAIVVHAAGAVALSVPADWSVRELPVGREVRLVIAPAISGEPKLPADGIWIAFNYQARLPEAPERLKSIALERCGVIEGRHFEVDPTVERLVVDHQPAARVEFATSSAAGNRRGFFLLAATPWGYCELHATAPVDVWPVRMAALKRIADSLHFGPPQIESVDLKPAARDAEPILGSWKSFRGRLRFFGDGRVALLSDQLARIETTDRPDQEVGKITGKLRAESDVLFIEWDDGSKLNFRWRRQGDRLLLTDHTGRTTQLRRLLE